jgi:hypothetical protein
MMVNNKSENGIRTNCMGLSSKCIMMIATMVSTKMAMQKVTGHANEIKEGQ